MEPFFWRMPACRPAAILILLLAGIACNSSQYARRTSEPLLYMTWNIRFDNPADGPDRWDLRRDALAAEILRRRPAVLGLQEALKSQLDFLEGQLGAYRRIGVGRDDGADKGEFSPILFDTTRLRLLESRTLWLSTTPEKPSRGWDAALPRIATLAVFIVKHSADTLRVVNTHFDHIGKEARLHSAELIVETLSEALKRRQKVVVMGDLNAEPSDAPPAFLRQFMAEACPPERSGEGTFNGFDPNRTQFPRIDYIWYAPRQTTLKHYEVPQPKTGGRHVSDHFPVLAVLE